MVLRTSSEIVMTRWLSSAAEGGCVSVCTAGWNWIRHLLGRGIMPNGPSHGHIGVMGKYGSPNILASGATSAIIGFFYAAATTETGMIGAPARMAVETKPPRPNLRKRYRSLNGLPVPLTPSGKRSEERRVG